MPGLGSTTVVISDYPRDLAQCSMLASCSSYSWACSCFPRHFSWLSWVLMACLFSSGMATHRRKEGGFLHFVLRQWGGGVLSSPSVSLGQGWTVALAEMRWYLPVCPSLGLPSVVWSSLSRLIPVCTQQGFMPQLRICGAWWGHRIGAGLATGSRGWTDLIWLVRRKIIIFSLRHWNLF